MIFSGKCVVVTGAGSGIGRAIAAGFCADGATVIGIGRTLYEGDKDYNRGSLNPKLR